MKRILQILVILFSSFSAKSGHINQGEINYKYLGNNKYEVSLIIRRDCRGVSFNNPSVVLRCDNTGNSKSLNMKLFKITDVTYICKSATKPCYPANTSGTGKGMEEHIYVDTLDFNGKDTAFKSCCSINLNYSICCRNGAITTGGSSAMFFVNSKFEKCIAANNSSPVFINNISNIIDCNQPLKVSFYAQDPDGDSLSYSLVDPQTGYGSYITWNSGFSAQSPLKPYFPVGYIKSKGPLPDANPPVGVYFDKTNGMFVATPIDCNESTIIAVKVSEWRKDSTGKYKKIGEITKDMQIWIETGNNNYPSISGNYNIQACEGEKISLNFFSNDKAYSAPPSKPVLNDTVKLSWYNPIKNSTIILDSNYIKLQAAIFEWTPQKGDARNTPYTFIMKATDNACPYTGFAHKNVNIYVYPKIKISNSINKIYNNTYAFKINIDNKKYPYIVSNNIKSGLPYDSRSFYFKSSNNVTSDLEIDTVVFLKNGTFIINQFFISQILCNQNTLSDTIKVEDVLEASLTKSADTILCKNIKSDFTCKLSNAKKPVTYTWITKNTSQTDTLGSFSYSFTQPDTILVFIKDADGKTTNTWVRIKISDLPDISAGDDKIACAENSVIVKAVNNNTDTLKWRWTFNKAIVSSIDTLIASMPGNYIVRATNKYFCENSDTFVRKNYKTDEVSLLSGRYCQNKNELVQNEIFSNNPNNFPVLQWSLLKTLKNSFGYYNPINKLLFDEDPSLNYNYKLYFGKSLIDLDTLWEDSLKFVVRAWDKNNCFSIDTSKISIIKMPEIEFGLPNYSICRNDSADLNQLVITKGTKHWFPVNLNGFDKWPIPETSEIKDGIIKPKFFKPSEGKYQIELSSTYDKCFAKDSFDLHIFPAPVPIISYVITKDSLIILDNSLYADYRKWYLGSVSKGKSKTITLSIFEADDKAIKLELSNSFSCFTDTVFSVNTVKVFNVKKNNVKVFPNPTANTLNLLLASPINNATWTIRNVTGKAVSRGEMSGTQNILDVSKLSSGVYYLNISNNEVNFSVPFVKTEN